MHFAENVLLRATNVLNMALLTVSGPRGKRWIQGWNTFVKRQAQNYTGRRAIFSLRVRFLPLMPVPHGFTFGTLFFFRFQLSKNFPSLDVIIRGAKRDD